MSISVAWAQCLAFFGTPLVIELLPGQLSGDTAGRYLQPQFNVRSQILEAAGRGIENYNSGGRDRRRTGKSTIAARVAEELGAVALNKDTVRAALFPPPVLDYSAEQDEISMEAIYHAAATILKASPRRAVILDVQRIQPDRETGEPTPPFPIAV